LPGRDPALEFVLKVASRCNLNCSYCYVFNQGDASWRQRPAFFSDEVLTAAIERIRRYIARSGQGSVRILFHGGEPLLAGHERLSNWCARLRSDLTDLAHVRLALQTNATLLDERFIEWIVEYDIDVGVSMDGPREVHDTFRVDHRGRGSYDDVERGLRLLREANRPINILSVIQFGIDPLLVHRHFVSQGASSINYLLPDYTHDTIAPVHRQYGPHPCADYLVPIFDDWWSNSTLDLKIPLFWNITRLVLGGDSRMDVLGNRPFHFVFIESDGAIEGLDVLRICPGGTYSTGLNVLEHDFHAIREASALHSAVMFDGVELPTACRSCRERETCAGGYLPHRHSLSNGFDNPSVWCADILELFDHIRISLGVSVDETAKRRIELFGHEPPAVLLDV
jgi:uncharacterized protein